MKSLICIAIVFLLNFNNFVKSDVCPTCLVENQNCTSDFKFTETCGSGLLCYPQAEASLEWTCQKYLKAGDICIPISDDRTSTKCSPGLICTREITSKPYTCVDYGFATLGEKCKTTDDCVGYLKCNFDGVCVRQNIDSCNESNECNYDENCVYTTTEKNTKKCTKQIKEGMPCTAKIDQSTPVCALGMSCVSATKIGVLDGTCEFPKKKSLGESCTYDRQCDTDNDYICTNNVCQKLVIQSPKVCNDSTASCGYYQTCSCKDNKCYQNYPFPSQTTDQLEQCAYDNKCVVVNNLRSHESCFSKHCRAKICDYYSTYYPDIPNSCKYQQYRDSFCNSSFKFNPSILSIFLILIILKLFI